MGFRQAQEHRILRLPRRETFSDTQRDALREELQTGDMRLYDHQCDALLEARRARGLVLPLSTGAGKTLTSFCLPAVLGAKRAVLYCPASLIDSVLREYDQYAPHFSGCTPPVVKSYASISTDHSYVFWTGYQPDLFIFDEAHRLSNTKSGRTRRVRAWRAEHPGSVAVAMTGTLFSRSYLEVCHIAKECLGDGSPLPTSLNGAQQLASQADPAFALERKRIAPVAPYGWVQKLLDRFGESRPHVAVRRWCSGTQGWLDEDFVYDETPITIGTVSVPSHPVCEEFFGYVSAHWTDYQGRPVATVPLGGSPRPHSKMAEGAIRWRLAGDLTLGFYTACVTPPSAAWFQARRGWQDLVDENVDQYYTPGGVALAVDSGALGAAAKRTLDRWRDFRENETPERQEFDLDVVTPGLSYALEWLRTHDRGVVWVERIKAARKLSELSGRPWFGAGQGLPGRPFIEDAEGPVIATVQANATGRNLQHKWCDNLIITGTHKYDIHQQLNARVYRIGQQRPVTSTYLLTDGFRHGQSEALTLAKQGSIFQTEALGSSTIFSLTGFDSKSGLEEKGHWPGKRKGHGIQKQ